MHRIGQLLAAGLGLLVTTAAYSQTEGQPTRPGGPPDGAPRDPSRFIERLMEGDTDHDGKLSKSEVPPQFADRLFERADTNKDGFLDKAELDELAKSGGPGMGPGPRGGRGGDEGGAGGTAGSAGAPQGFEGGMKASGRALRNLRRSAFDASSRNADLEAVQGLQSGLVAAKGSIGQAPMSKKAKEKFGEDKAAFATEMRRDILKALMQATELEMAILEGKGDRAKTLATAIAESRDAGHSFFQDEEEGGGEGQRPARGAGGQGGRGRGARGGAGGAGSEN